jgi:hypothetical protein
VAKKIKSFTVDEGAYNDLVQMFKHNDVDVSVSLFVDGCIKELASKLKKLEITYEGLEINGEKVEVPFSYVINSLVFKKGLKQRDYEIYGDEKNELFVELLEWNAEYGAEKRGFTKRLFHILQSPLFCLSADKKFVLDKKSGKKEFSVVQTKDGLLDIGNAVRGKK